jgi:hypothetical protein
MEQPNGRSDLDISVAVISVAVVPLNPKLLAAASQESLSPIDVRPPTSTHFPLAGRG